MHPMLGARFVRVRQVMNASFYAPFNVAPFNASFGTSTMSDCLRRLVGQSGGVVRKGFGKSRGRSKAGVMH